MMGRTFDSSGPDVKIRGTAAHIYEKYQALARDANASGDRVGAESYLQHAEHYFRLLNSFQNANGGYNNGRPNGMPQHDGQGPQPGPRLQGPEEDDEESEGEGAEDGEEADPVSA